MKKEFTYIPRVSLSVGHYEEERIQELVRCCEKYGYKELMFFINAENLFRGFLSLEELKPHVALIKRAKIELDKIGVKTSINPWTTLGHAARGNLGIAKNRFAKMVGDKGFCDELVPCPLDEEWQEYLCEYFAYIAEEIQPHILWLEDDFRLSNHGLTSVGNDSNVGCFCEKHLALYEKELGRTITREEMAKGIASGDKNGEYRRVFAKVANDVMVNVAQKLSARIHKTQPKVKLGLMSGNAKHHSLEGRNWHTLLCVLAGENEPINRIHLPMYRQISAQDYGWSFHDTSMQVRAMCPEETRVLPEVESAMFSPYTKSRNLTRFQVESALALCPKGITFDQDCFAGSGIVAAYGYGEELLTVKKYLDSAAREEIPFKALDGVVVPLSEDATLRSRPKANISGLTHNENYWASHLASVGVAWKYEKNSAYENKIVAASGEYFTGLTDEEIKGLFEKNFLLLDARSVEILFQRGLQTLIGAKSIRRLGWRKGECSFEEAATEKTYLGIRGARTSAIVTCPDFLAVVYEKQPTVYTEMMDYEEKFVSHALVKTDNAFIFPYFIDTVAGYSPVPEKHHGLLTTMRVEVLKEALSSLSGYATPVIFHNLPYVATYYYRCGKYDYILLSNFSDDGYPCVQLKGLPAYKSVAKLSRNCGRWKKTTLENGVFTDGIAATTTVLLRLER